MYMRKDLAVQAFFAQWCLYSRDKVLQTVICIILIRISRIYMPVINYRDLKSREGYIGILGYTIGLDTAWMILLLYIEFAWIYKR